LRVDCFAVALNIDRFAVALNIDRFAVTLNTDRLAIAHSSRLHSIGASGVLAVNLNARPVCRK
jgi:hypothetical protein